MWPRNVLRRCFVLVHQPCPVGLARNQALGINQEGKHWLQLFSSIVGGPRRMLLTSRVKAISLLGFIGVLIAAVSAIGGAAVHLLKMIVPSSIVVKGWPSLILVNLFFGGFITFMIAVILEYISILVLSAHGKPLFFVVDRSPDERLVEYFTKRLP